MTRNMKKFIETDSEYLKSCFFTPKNLTDEDKERIDKLRKQAEEIRKYLNEKESTTD